MTDWLYQYLRVPAIDADELQAMLAHITPLVAGPAESGMLHRLDIEGIDPSNESYIWERNSRVREPLVHQAATGSTDIPTLHTYGHPSLFKPTLEEVMASIRLLFAHDWKKVGFFWLPDVGNMDATDVWGQFHIARCRLYPVGAADETAGTLGRGKSLETR